jgi:hypothetical protein
MNIVGLDYSIIKRLVISGKVKKFSDIYLLEQNDFINLSSINLFEDSNKSQFIIGKKTSEKIAITLFDSSIVSVDMMLVTDYSIIPCKTEYVIEDFLKEPKSSSIKVLGGYYSYEEKRILRY